MTLTIPTDFQTMLDGKLTTIATCIAITRLDGEEFLFTDHDVDIVYDGNTYKTKGGFDASAIEYNQALAVDNLDIQGVVTDDGITTEDLKRGLFNEAVIEIFLVDYEDLTTGNRVLLKTGTLGDISAQDNNFFTAEIMGLASKLQNRIGKVYTPTCSVRRLGGTGCGVSLGSFTKTSTVVSVTNNKVFSHSTNSQADGYFNFGILTWTSGSANEGLEMEIKSYSSNTFTLQLPMPKDIQPGDAFTAVRGCDRTFNTCKTTYSNGDNFRGFPHLPGLDQILKSGA